MSNYKIIDAKNFKTINPQNSVVIDVRTDDEHREKSLKISHQHIIFDKANPFNFASKCKDIDKSAEIYVLCKGGTRAKIAAEQLISKGFNNVSVVEGGIVACENCGLEIEGVGELKSNFCQALKTPISLERQVRIVAGGIAFLGSFFALTISAKFALIPLFVGGGLVFAGITDSCAMALLLMKAPWNKIKK
jgi:rhodanese-related sulfurtransferase